MAGNFAPRKALALHRLRWAGAGVLALVLAAQTAWLMKPHRAPAADQSQPASCASAIRSQSARSRNPTQPPR